MCFTGYIIRLQAYFKFKGGRIKFNLSSKRNFKLRDYFGVEMYPRGANTNYYAALTQKLP